MLEQACTTATFSRLSNDFLCFGCFVDLCCRAGGIGVVHSGADLRDASQVADMMNLAPVGALPR
jgi:hypothetical protein